MRTAHEVLASCTAAAAAGIVVVSCATVHVTSYAKPGADLAGYRQFELSANEPFETGDPRLDNNQIFLEHLETTLAARLSDRGWLAGTADADRLVVYVRARVGQKLDVAAAAPYAESCSSCGPLVFDAGTVMIDLVDARSGTLLWRGWSEGSLDGAIDNQRWLEAHVDEAVARILAQLPSAAKR